MKTSLLATMVVAALVAAPAAAQVFPPNDVNLPASGTGFSLNGLSTPFGTPGGAPSCPPATAVGTSFSGALTQDGRIFRDAIASTCPGKAYPGNFNVGTTYNYETFTYSNTSATPACVTVNFDPNAGATPCGTNAHASAYIGSYDPANQGANFVGDVGSSVTQPFSFEVPAGQNMVLAVTNTSAAAVCDFSFQVVALPCSPAGPPPAFIPTACPSSPCCSACSASPQSAASTK